MFTALYMAYSTWGKGDGDPIIFIFLFICDYQLVEMLIKAIGGK